MSDDEYYCGKTAEGLDGLMLECVDNSGVDHEWHTTASGVNFKIMAALDPAHFPHLPINEEDVPKGVKNMKFGGEKTTVNVPPNLLLDADSMIHGQRVVDYGTKTESFGQIADFWTDYLNRHFYKRNPDVANTDFGMFPLFLTPQDVANMMILMKVSRAQNGFHRDSYVDIAGYAGCVEMIERGE